MSYSIKYIPLKMSDLIKYGVEQAQIEQIKRGVILAHIFQNDFRVILQHFNNRKWILRR